MAGTKGRAARLMLAAATLTGALVPMSAWSQGTSVTSVKDDAVVMAVIDSGFSPYHQDFLQNYANSDIRRLPLDRPPDTWLPGFPRSSRFASYQPLRLTLDGAPGTSMSALHNRDAAQWKTVAPSSPTSINYRWIPGTKVVGALTFGPLPTDRPVDRLAWSSYAPTIYGSGGGDHGMGTTSVAVGSHHGECPSCLLVFIQYTDQESAERALTWAHEQPWIDVISNSWAWSTTIQVRDRVYNDTNLPVEKAATERGQTTFFSAGNGLDNAFTVPNQTLLNSEEGPDWVVTVGATASNAKDYSGSGRPVDIAGIGAGHPSAYQSTTTDGGATFYGTSSATAQIAGTYAQTLFEARRVLAGPSRLQREGVIGVGAFRCGRAVPNCALADGRLTATELRTGLFRGATPTDGGLTDGVESLATTPSVGDMRFAAEGYGAYAGLIQGRGPDQQVRLRFLGPLLGDSTPPDRPTAETAWFRVRSWCRQHIWGRWGLGSYVNAKSTPLPGPDRDWPTRTALLETCPFLVAPPKQLV